MNLMKSVLVPNYNGDYKCKSEIKPNVIPPNWTEERSYNHNKWKIKLQILVL